MGGYNFAYKGTVAPNGDCRLYVTKEFILGHLSWADETLHFTLLQHELGASYQGVYALFLKPVPMLNIPTIIENSEALLTCKVEIGIDIDNHIYNEFGGNMALITAAVQVQMDEVQLFFRDKHAEYSPHPFSVELIYYNRGPYPKPTPYDFIGNYQQGLFRTHEKIRSNWSLNQPCILKDVILQFMNHPHPAYGQIYMDTGGTGNICESTTPTIFINHRPDATSPHRLTPQYNPVIALTIAHELGHLITKTGAHLEEYPFCPASETDLCNTLPSPIMCSGSGLARGLHEAYFSNCSRQRISQTLTNLGPICFSDERPVPELPCPPPTVCQATIKIEADNTRPIGNCSDYSLINYNITVCNDCGVTRSLKVGFLSNANAQQMEYIDAAFNPVPLNPGASSLSYTESAFSDWAPGECRSYTLQGRFFTGFESPTFNLAARVFNAAAPNPNIYTDQASITIHKGFIRNVTGGTIQSPQRLSEIMQQEQWLSPQNADLDLYPFTFNVSGVFEIDLHNIQGLTDLTYAMKRAVFNMSGNARIIVSGAGRKLLWDRVKVLSCGNSMWDRVMILPGVTLMMNDSELHDGNLALTLHDEAKAALSNNRFYNNRIGVYVPEGHWVVSQLQDDHLNTSVLAPENYANQNVDISIFSGNRFETKGNGLKAPYTGHKGTAGVWVYGLRGLILGMNDTPENWYLNLYNGVVAFNSNLRVANSFFMDITQAGNFANAPAFSGYGIYSVGNTAYYRLLDVKGFGKYGTPAFRDCATGIFADKMAAYIEHCNMEQVQQGIHLQNARFRRLDVARNNISAARAGINLFQNTPVRCTVDNNDVLVAGAAYSPGTGIRMEESPFGVQNYQYYTVQNNTVRMLSGAEGISLQAGRYVQLYNNTVQLSETGLPQNGISLWGAGNALVRCNTLLGPKSYNSTFPNRGIAGLGAYGALISCNTTDYLRTGILFDGMADATALRGNNLHRHHTGLQILDNGHIGEQAHHGNRWFGPFTEFGAKHLALDFDVVDQSRFRIDPAASSGQAFAYEPFWSAVGQWFITQDVADESIFTCTNPTYDACQTAAPPLWVKTETDVLDNKLAQNALQSPGFAQELGWTGRRHLYSRIAENNLPLQPGTFVRSFYMATSGNSIAQLHQTQQSIQAAYPAASPAGMLLDQQDAALKEGLAQLRRNSLLQQQAETTGEQVALTAERTLLRSSLHADLAYADALAQDAADAADAQLGTAAALNAVVAAAAVYEQNEKNFYDLYIAWQQAESLTPAQQDVLKNIAFQCPWRGGDAVFYARSLYALLEPDALYDDALLCNSSGQYRALPTTETEDPGFDLYPNPASDHFVLRRFGLPEDAESIAVVFDLLGRELLRTSVGTKSIAVIDTKNFSPGIVFVALITDGRRTGIRKMVLQK